MSILLAILAKIGLPVSIGAAVLMLVWGLTERIQLAGAHLTEKKLTAQVAGAKADYATCQGNYRSLSDAASRQEAAVQALKAESDAKTVQLVKAAQQARSARAMADKESAQIEAMTVAGPRTCPAVDALFSGLPQ